MFRVSDYLAQFLAERGITQVYTLSGGMIMQFIDSLVQHGGIEVVTVHHEQAAAFAADAEARVTGRPAVALATSGPGAINLLTGIGSCYFDSVPAVFITGQVNTTERRGSRDIRQLGFQETDIAEMAAPITKATIQVRTVAEFPAALDDAFRIAMEGRPGPVLVDVPMNVTRSEMSPISVKASAMRAEHPVTGAQRAYASSVVTGLKNGRSPMVLAGRGVLSSGSEAALQQLVETLDVPVVWSLLGIGVLPSRHPLAVGMIGTYGNRWANIAFATADPLVVLGSRLDIRQTGADTASFKGDRRVFHVDVEAGEINNRVQQCDGFVGRLEDFLRAAIEVASPARHEAWRSEIGDLRARWPDTAELLDIRGINPNVLMHELSRPEMPMVISLDVGQHQMWAAQSLDVGPNQRVITSAGMGAMGYALPAALGAAFATRRAAPVLCIAGDAGFQLNIQELETIRRNRLPVKIAVINNGAHGMTRQFQQTYFDGRYEGTVNGYSAPDFAAIGRAYGIASGSVSEPGHVRAAVARLWADPLEPYLLDVKIDAMTNVYPKLAFGRPVSEMEPFATPIAMEGT
jgi:acetolactate synthase-1/2/3 large subunit